MPIVSVVPWGVRAVFVVAVLAACGRIGFSTQGDGGGVGDGASGDQIGGDGGGGGPDARPPIVEGPLLVPASTFDRENNPTFPATVSEFMLDRYEVTVRRFRPFVEGGFGVQPTAPALGAGAHPVLGSGSGWNTAWATELEPDTVTFRSKLISTLRSTYSPTPGVKDELPIVDASWFEAFAFCIWDGGRLPTYAEYQAAVLGGMEQRVYPWGDVFDPALLAMGETQLVGSHPGGDGRWGHADLAGNVDEWLFDRQQLPVPCIDCAAIGDAATPRALGGWDWGRTSSDYANGGAQHGASPQTGLDRRGFRCVH